MKSVWRILNYVFHVYAGSVILCMAFLLNRYAIEVTHVESSHVGIDTWLTTLTPDSIVFDTEKSFVHVHKVRWK